MTTVFLPPQVQDLQAAVGAAQAKELSSQAAAAACKAAAEAGSVRCKQLEKEADGLARDVAVLQVMNQQNNEVWP